MEELAGIKECTLCKREFPVFEKDLSFYERYDVSTPALCFDCRLQRRLAFYNRRKLYRRTCDFSKKPIISMFSPDKPYTVYEKDLWYSDAWDPLGYGRDFDFSRPFFEQFAELQLDVPQLSMAVIGQNINSDFTNDNMRLKNCYLAFDCSESEDVLYGETFIHTKDSCNVLSVTSCELCFECTSCHNCYNLKHSRFCKGCYDSWFLRDCIGCKNCFGCCNLHQKEYYIFNEPRSRDEYDRFIEEFDSGNFKTLSNMEDKVEQFFKSKPVRALRSLQNLNSLGSYLDKCKNTYWCFNCADLEDCRYCTDVLMGGKDSMDIHVWGDRMELCYNCSIIGENCHNVLCSCFIGIGCRDLAYCTYCTRGCTDLFGCAGLKRHSYCILNQQYSKDEYRSIRKRIVEHMRETGEWGEFFPPRLSPFGYNESLAPPYFPLKREEVLERGWNWCDFEAPVSAIRSIPASELPGHINNVPKDITDSAILCAESDRPFKIIKKELELLMREQLPLPRYHPDERHNKRFEWKKPYSLFDRNCMSCNKAITSCFPQERPEIIYCEECYHKEMY